MRSKKPHNPYLKEFRIALKEPDAHDDWDLQWSLAHRFSWAVPTSTTLSKIQEFSPCGIVEIGAGTGYWASLLQQMGVDVVCYDTAPVELGVNRFHNDERTNVPVVSFTRVLEGGARAAARHPDRVLMLCWPPHDMNKNRCNAERYMSNRALTSFKGNRLIYIGQPRGGITGSELFHRMLARDWDCVLKIRTPNFRGKRTSLYLYKRRHDST